MDLTKNTKVNDIKCLKTIVAHQSVAQAFAVAHEFEALRRIVVVLPTSTACEEIINELRLFVDAKFVIEFPAWDSLAFEHVSPQAHISATRIATLAKLYDQNSSFICVMSVPALMQRMLPLVDFFSASQLLKLSDLSSVVELTNLASALAYSNSGLVEEPGEYAARGHVFDIFPPGYDFPIRIEFKNNKIDRIKYFNPDTQRSTEDVSSVHLLPAREVFSTRKGYFIRDELNKIKERGKQLETPPREIVRTISSLRSAELHPGIEFMQLLLCSETSSVFELLNTSTYIALVARDRIFEEIARYQSDLHTRYESLTTNHYLIPEFSSCFLETQQILQLLESSQNIHINSLETLDAGSVNTKVIEERSTADLRAKLTSKIGTGEALDPLVSALRRWRNNGFEIVLVVGTLTRAERLQRILLDIDIEAPIVEEALNRWQARPLHAGIIIALGSISQGLELTDQKLVFIAEQEIFHSRSFRTKRRTKSSLKRILASLSQLKEEDYVVHADYGVGIYRGLKHLSIEDNECDFLHIDYADSKLFLPVHSIAKIQKFTAAEGQKPQLDKLASTRWSKTKQRVRNAVIPLASELLKLYASRSVAKGWRFDPAGAQDEEFADQFNFDETPDQMKAIQDTLEDMARERPMDRLVCGDVGFGKTEVALRAAMKATQHAKQVAVLAPTTILVEQHCQTFVNRFKEYPVKVGAISRFYSERQNKETLQALEDGTLDIIVGTQKLLSRKTVFKDLGLVIVDEEHRLGVKHKEKLKSLKRQVDVLTLTATPIPRTLHMALLGIRDVSVISTPPLDRKLVQTYLATYDDQLIRDAIVRELNRSGQVFYVHNRVRSIDETAARIHQLVPEAKVGIVHGELSERALETTMQAFLKGEINVLVATSIIESGLDFPTANTIIVERADLFGLAQAYQLRGRVGRSTRQAYCYFLIPKGRALSVDAERRLHALQSLDDLGLGFNLAVRDLEIRGAGNLLGKEQSGCVSSVGFDLYTKLLKEAILNLKGEDLEIEDIVEPEIKLPLEAFIPESYVPEVSERLMLYQRFASASDEQEIEDLLNECLDRFGNAGKELLTLADLMKLRTLLKRWGISKLEGSERRVLLEFNAKAPFNVLALVAYVKQRPEEFRASSSGSLTMLQPGKSLDELRARISTLFEQVSGT